MQGSKNLGNIKIDDTYRNINKGEVLDIPDNAKVNVINGILEVNSIGENVKITSHGWPVIINSDLPASCKITIELPEIQNKKKSTNNDCMLLVSGKIYAPLDNNQEVDSIAESNININVPGKIICTAVETGADIKCLNGKFNVQIVNKPQILICTDRIKHDWHALQGIVDIVRYFQSEPIPVFRISHMNSSNGPLSTSSQDSGLSFSNHNYNSTRPTSRHFNGISNFTFATTLGTLTFSALFCSRHRHNLSIRRMLLCTTAATGIGTIGYRQLKQDRKISDDTINKIDFCTSLISIAAIISAPFIATSYCSR